DALEKPYAMVGLNIIAADTDEEAQKLATSHEQQFLNLIRGRTGKLNPPVDNMDELWTPQEKAIVRGQLSYTIAGSKETVAKRLPAILEETQADEIIVTAQVYDHRARLRSYEILAEVFQGR
ncbi:hypothetical protein BG52_07580, partial [Paenibacillus darwinianus]